VRADRYHVTLQFLGGQPDQFPAALARSAAAVAASLPPAPAFDLRIDVAGSFRGRAAPWWLGSSRVPEPLRELWRRLRESLRAADLPHDERDDFTPHVTVMRDAREPLPASALGDAALDWPVSSFVLMHSRSGAQAPGYDVLETWPLRPAAD
jgi:2'-5' RNA ligase